MDIAGRLPGQGIMKRTKPTIVELITDVLKGLLRRAEAKRLNDDDCPECSWGTVYETKRPGVLVRITNQSPLRATIYQLQKLRCNLCGKVFKARVPERAGTRKYDATAGSMITLLKYGSDMPLNRFAGLQGRIVVDV